MTRISLLQEEGAAFLGSPVWGSSDYFLSFVGKAVDKVASLQDRLGGLGNPQVELHLLRSCLGVCKLNHLLRTISPNCVISQLERFDYNIRSALGRICKSSISDLSWLQATLPCSMRGLGLREATITSSAAFLDSCFSSQELCYCLLQSFSGGPDVFPSIPDQDAAVLYHMRILYHTRMVRNFVPYAYGMYHTRTAIPYAYGTYRMRMAIFTHFWSILSITYTHAPL